MHENRVFLSAFFGQREKSGQDSPKSEENFESTASNGEYCASLRRFDPTFFR